MDTRTLKEIFYQAADGGIPSHWVVQYYTNKNPLPDAEYFGTESKANEFADKIRAGQ